LSLDDPLESSRQRVAVEPVPFQIVRSALDDFPDDIFVSRGADNQDRGVRRRPPDLVERRDSLAVRQAQVEQDR